MKKVWHVVKQPKYLLITIITTLFFLSITNTVMNFQLLKNTLFERGITSAVSLELALIHGGLWQSQSHILQIFIAALVGVTFALLAFKLNKSQSTSIASGVAGALVALITTGCVPCGLSLLPTIAAIFGVVLAPISNDYFSALSVILLSTSIYGLSKSVKLN